MPSPSEAPVPENAAEAAIAICGGEVRAVVVVCAHRIYDETIRDWSADRRVTEIVRVPIEVARHFLFEKWPGRDAAIAWVAALHASETL